MVPGTDAIKLRVYAAAIASEAGLVMGAFKHIGIVAWCAGIAVGIGVMAWSGIDAVGHAVASVGWGMPLVVLTRCATVSIAGLGWWFLFPPSTQLPLRVAVLLRFVREAVNTLLPLTQVGGEVIGVRLVTFWGVPGTFAGASVIVDVMLQAATQFLFAALGVIALAALGTDMSLARTLGAGLLLAIPALGLFYLTQRKAGYRVVDFIFSRLKIDSKWSARAILDRVYQSLSMIYARPSNVGTSLTVHMVGWLVGVNEVLIVLSFMGHPVTIAEALVIESLLQAVRGAAFAIPSAFGAQEAGLILLCGLFQIPPDQALALSLIKRAADIVVGVPGLVMLQILEGRRLKASLAAAEVPSRIPFDLQSEPR